MDKKEHKFQSVLYDFISFLPLCSSQTENGELTWGDARYDFDINYSWPNTKKALEECGLGIDYPMLMESLRKPLFLYVKKNEVLFGDGWISFKGDGITILYDHWDAIAHLDDETRISNSNIDSLKTLFNQYLETLHDWDGDLDKKYCNKRFGEIETSYWKNRLACIDAFLQQFNKHIILPTHISKTNLIRICENDEYLRLYANKDGELAWDILSFMRDHVDFSDCNFNEHADFKLAREIFNIVHFEPFFFGKKTNEKVQDLSRLITKKKLNWGHVKADEEIHYLKQSIDELIENGERLFEIKEYQQRFFIEKKWAFENGYRVLTFMENAHHCSDFEYDKTGDAHRSYLMIEKTKRKNEIKLCLIPSNRKYTPYYFTTKKGYEELAIALIVGYFSSPIENKRQSLLITPLFKDFGIILFEKSKL